MEKKSNLRLITRIFFFPLAQVEFWNLTKRKRWLFKKRYHAFPLVISPAIILNLTWVLQLKRSKTCTWWDPKSPSMRGLKYSHFGPTLINTPPTPLVIQRTNIYHVPIELRVTLTYVCSTQLPTTILPVFLKWYLCCSDHFRSEGTWHNIYAPEFILFLLVEFQNNNILWLMLAFHVGLLASSIRKKLKHSHLFLISVLYLYVCPKIDSFCLISVTTGTLLLIDLVLF